MSAENLIAIDEDKGFQETKTAPAQPVDGFLFIWEEAISAENHIAIDEDKGFPETKISPALQQPDQSRPALRSI